MKNDRLLTRRRALRVGAAVLGAAGAATGTARLFTIEDPAGEAWNALAAGGPQVRTPLSALRLQPMAGYGSPSRPPARTAVRHEPIRRMPERGRRMVLTFDDGPNPEYTPGILRTLREYGVRAMFFVLGKMAAGNKDLLREMADNGHIVGNHTWAHPLLTTLPRSKIRSEMERTCEVIEDAYGEAPLWFRAPYGAWNRDVFQLGAELGMEPLAWTMDSRDWTTPGTPTIVQRVEKSAASGVIVLSHDAGGNRAQSVRALRTYLPYLLDSGYHITVPGRQFT
ncbi:MAG: polysaccharide deacetylase family protein [Streptomyces sp.]|jgi:peptidoglycan/xylan/chitin deacetylase (PgdA/CDA1 family)|nr:polysaccharide deacetylase family protein [Streptomyces sp.]